MLNKFANTFFTKGVSAVISFAIIIITAKILGAEVRGNISLLILGISVITMISQVAGGPALVYLIPKSNVSSLTGISYLWAIMSCVVFSFTLTVTNFVPATLFIPLLAISLLQCLAHIHLTILVGKEKIHYHNLIMLVQVFSQIIFFAFFLFIIGEKNINPFVMALFISNGITYLFGVAASYKYLKGFIISDIPPLFKTMFKKGIFVLLANLTHLLSIRIIYYFLNLFTGTKAVGVFSTGVSITESILLISSSVSFVIFSRIVNSNDQIYAQKLTIRLSKACFILTLPVLLMLSLLPISFYILLFGPDFSAVKDIIIALSFGIASMSFSMIYSHYFAGIGKYHINAFASFLAFIITLGSGYFVIPVWGITGAAWIASLSYIASSLFLFTLFLKHSSTNLFQLMPSFNDISLLNKHLLYYLKKINS